MAVCWEEPMTAALRFWRTFTAQPPWETNTPQRFSFIQPVWHQAWIRHDITLRLCVSYCLLFFISSPPRRSLSGFSRVGLCRCLSICVFVCLTRTHLERGRRCRECLGLRRRWEEIIPPPHPPTADFQDYTCKTHRDTQQQTAYAGLFWAEKTIWRGLWLRVDTCWGSID